MDYQVNGTSIVLFLTGRVDTNNADAVSEEVGTILAQNPHTSLVLDAKELEYLSSAGLRVVLKYRKAEKDFKIINVGSELYEIFEMTGFSEMMPIERARRQLSVDGCQVIGQGAKGTVYRWNEDTIVKVYKNPDALPDIEKEREYARKAFVLGIPTAIPYDIVMVGNSYGSVFELLDAKSYSQLIAEEPERFDELCRSYADLLKLIHDTSVKTTDFPSIKDVVCSWVDMDAKVLSAEQIAVIRDMVNAVPDVNTMLHCDFHTNNIMMQKGETLLIDMDTLSYGHPIFELANIYITYIGFGEVNPKIVENFMGLPYDVTQKLWDRFFYYYFDQKSEEEKAEILDKIRLLSYIRLLRHTLRRGIDDDDSQRTIALCAEQITTLLTKVNTFEF